MNEDQSHGIDLAAAEFLTERLAVHDPLGDDPGECSDFDSWREVFASPGPDLFSARLQPLRLSEADARNLCARRTRPNDAAPPAWVRELTAAARYKPERPCPPNDYPFSAVWWPLAAYAHQTVFTSSPGGKLLHDSAQDGLTGSLLSDLCGMAAQAVYAVFAKERETGSSFEDFVRATIGCGYKNLFGPFPALARCVSIVLSSWIGTTELFLSRLSQDWGELSQLAGPGEPQRVQTIVPGLSDKHDGGSQAMLLEFQTGGRIVYKPKDMSLEVSLPAINAWLEAEGARTRFRFARSIARENYGWSEFVAQRPCETPGEVQRYFYQAGALLCLAYVLNAKDLFLDNLIAAGPDPVPIDLEAFFQGEMQRADRLGADPLADLPEAQRRGSVIETGLLPIWQISGVGTVCDLSGLSGQKEFRSGPTRLGWRDVNSDRMKPVREPVSEGPAKNTVILAGQVQRPERFTAAITRGFSDFYTFLSGRRESFLKFLDRFHHSRSRLIFRATPVYARLIRESLVPAALTSGVNRSLVFERLYRPALRSAPANEVLINLISSEVSQLTHFDVPRLHASVAGRDLTLNGGAIAGALHEPPVVTVQRRLEFVTDDYLDYHLENIREALRRKPEPACENTSEAKLLDLAQTYAREISGRAKNEGASFFWPLPTFYSEKELPLAERLGIYTGDLGTLIFLAGAGRIAGVDYCGQLSETFRLRCLEKIRDPMPEIGICNGLGSLIYGALLLERFTGDSSWIRFGETVASRVTPDHIRRCAEPDLIYGIAGLLVALTGLHERTGDSRPLRLAEVCVRTLASRFAPGAGWVRPNGDSALGFAHGIAGITFAICRYAAVSGQSVGIELVTEAFAFDRQFYSRAQHNWPVLASPAPCTKAAWCSGSPGILLGRAAAWKLLQDERLLRELDEVLEHGYPDFRGNDHWCCGNLGNAEILLCLGEVLGRESLKQRSRALVRRTVSRALESTFYRFSGNLGENHCFQPSLFRGLSGVGYSLLRSARPDEFPSVLNFEW